MQTLKRSFFGMWHLVYCGLIACLFAFSTPAQSEKIVLMWQVNHNISDADLTALQGKGVNVIQSWRVLDAADNDAKKYLDRMHARQFKVILSMNQLAKRIDGKETYDYQRAEAFIKKWKSHPALFAWHTFDEPSDPSRQFSGKFQASVYKFVKQLDPKTKVFISWNGISKDQYDCCFPRGAFDVLDLHAYVKDSVGRRQKNLVDNFRKFSGFRNDYPLLFTVRAFNNPGKREDLENDGIREQVDFFMSSGLTKNVGFYGWNLHPSIGLDRDAGLRSQFLNLRLP